jgi:hypothetical protein
MRASTARWNSPCKWTTPVIRTGRRSKLERAPTEYAMSSTRSGGVVEKVTQEIRLSFREG